MAYSAIIVVEFQLPYTDASFIWFFIPKSSCSLLLSSSQMITSKIIIYWLYLASLQLSLDKLEPFYILHWNG